MTLASISFASCDNGSEGADAEELVEVLRLIDDINEGGKFTGDRIATVRVSASSVPEGAISDITLLGNKYAATKLYTGDYITEAKTTEPEATVSETNTESETQSQKKGCGAAIGTASAGVALTACAAVLKKKKED